MRRAADFSFVGKDKMKAAMAQVSLSAGCVSTGASLPVMAVHVHSMHRVSFEMLTSFSRMEHTVLMRMHVLKLHYAGLTKALAYV